MGPDSEEEALFTLYDEYILLTARITSEATLSTSTGEDKHAMKAMNDPIRPISSAIKYYVNAYPADIALAKRLASDAGFKSIEQWMSISDHLQIEMIVISLDENSQDHIEKNRFFSNTDMNSFDQERREYVETVEDLSEKELAQFAENRPRFLRAIGN